MDGECYTRGPSHGGVSEGIESKAVAPVIDKSLYTCISLVLYNRHSEADSIRESVWNAFSGNVFGMPTKALEVYHDQRSAPQMCQSSCGDISLDAWTKLYAIGKSRSSYRTTNGEKRHSVDLTRASSSSSSPVLDGRHASLAKTLVGYVILNSGGRCAPDIEVVAPILTQVWSIKTVVFEAPAEPDTRISSMVGRSGSPPPMYVHAPEHVEHGVSLQVFRRGRVYEIVTDAANMLCHPIPNRLGGSIQNTGLASVSCYSLSIFSPEKRKCFEAGSFKQPLDRGDVVHSLSLDFTLGKRNWQYVIKGCQSMGSQVFIYAASTEQGVEWATYVSSWCNEFVDPVLYMKVHEKGIYIVPADTKKRAMQILIKEKNCRIRDIRLTREQQMVQGSSK